MGNTELDANTHFPAPFGMGKKLPIALRKNPAKSCGNGTTTILTPVPGKNGNCQRLPGSQQLRSQIGSKTGDKEIGQLRPKIGRRRPFDHHSGLSAEFCSIFIIGDNLAMAGCEVSCTLDREGQGSGARSEENCRSRGKFKM